MIEQEVKEEIGRQLSVWAGAYKNLDTLYKEVAEMDIARSILMEKVRAEEEIRDSASQSANGLIISIEDNEENRAEIEAILGEYVAPVTMKGMLG